MTTPSQDDQAAQGGCPFGRRTFTKTALGVGAAGAALAGAGLVGERGTPWRRHPGHDDGEAA
ncbi:hypothetical protein ABZ474_54685, partial [Streptomyces mirabilis]